MRFQKTLDFAKILKNTVLVGTLAVIASFFLEIIPCQKIINRDPISAICTLPNPFQDISDLNTKFYFISNNPLFGLVINFLIFSLLFIILILIFKRKFLFKRNHNKILDLTKG